MYYDSESCLLKKTYRKNKSNIPLNAVQTQIAQHPENR